MAKKIHDKAKNREDAIENLICGAIRICYSGNMQIAWDSEKSLVQTHLLLDLRLCLKEVEKFNK